MRRFLIKVLKTMLILSAILLCCLCFVYTPYYSRSVLFLIEKLNPAVVNPVAAQSQQQAGLKLGERVSLEPGSVEWIARQSYLNLLWEYIQQGKSHELSRIYAAYQMLQREIEVQLLNRKLQQRKAKTPSSTESSQNYQNSETTIKQAEQVQLSDKYRQFMLNFLHNNPNIRQIEDELFADIAELYQQHGQQTPVSLQRPYAIVVVGGGLTRDKNTKEIIVNAYTEQRLKTTIDVVKDYNLPIVLSGVEAPYMQKRLQQYDVKANLLEKKSMNTCENSRFSSLLLQKKGGAPTVILITDMYHMPRTRRLFADDGIATIPMVANMPTELTAWQPSRINYDHSRRANYELLATLRDKFLGRNDCREVPAP